MCNYVDENTLSGCGITFKSIKILLDMDISNSIKWFSLDLMKMNQGKCHVMILSKHVTLTTTFMTNNISIEVENSVQPLAMKIHSNLICSMYFRSRNFREFREFCPNSRKFKTQKILY